MIMATLVQGQDLKRSAFLGAMLTDVARVEEDLGTDTGLHMPEILPGGSLGEMGVPVGSVLQQVNDKPVSSMQELMGTLSGIKEGDKLKVSVFTGGQLKTYRGIAKGKPQEEHPNAQVEYGTVQYEGNRLRSLLYLPDGVAQPPVVFFLQGYTCQSIEMRNNNPAKQLIDTWINQGYAVFLVEKPGMGDSESAVPCMEIDFDEELLAFSHAYRDLRQNTLIDNSQIFLFGHSMGGIVAPLLAGEHAPAGIMVFGIVGKNWYDYMIDIYTEQPLLFGTPEAQIKADNRYNLPFVKDLLVHKKSNEELLASELYGDFLQDNGIAQSLEQGYYIARHYTYWQALADVDVPGAWAKVKAPVLVMHGEYDIQAIHPKYGEMIVANVNEQGGSASFELFPGTEHAFLKFDSRDELLQVMSSGGYGNAFQTHFNTAVAKKSLEWMKNLSK
jgi:pimeloyl-ACP methyl ester carboxylesterase